MVALDILVPCRSRPSGDAAMTVSTRRTIENWRRAIRITALPSGEAATAGPGAAVAVTGASTHAVATIVNSRFILAPIFVQHPNGDVSSQPAS